MHAFRLIIEDDEGRRFSVPISDRPLTIGRGSDAAVRLTERNVSRRHAVVSRVQGAIVVEDLKSSNGVRVNGARVEGKRNLREGDFIEIGDYHLAVQVETQPATTPGIANDGLFDPTSLNPEANGSGFDPHALDPHALDPHALDPHFIEADESSIEGFPLGIRPETTEPRAVPPPPAPAQPTSAERPRPIQPPWARLIPEVGGYEGVEFHIDRTPILLGSGPACLFRLDDASVAPIHAEIRVQEGAIDVVDRSEAAGVVVNGTSVRRTTLRAGDIVDLGLIRLRYVAPDEFYHSTLAPPKADRVSVPAASASTPDAPGQRLDAARPMTPAARPMSASMAAHADAAQHPRTEPRTEPRTISATHTRPATQTTSRTAFYGVIGAAALIIVGGLTIAIIRGAAPTPEGPPGTRTTADDPLFEQARAEYGNGRYEQAVVTLRTLLDTRPDHADARKLMTQAELDAHARTTLSDARAKREQGDLRAAFDLARNISQQSVLAPEAEKITRELLTQMTAIWVREGYDALRAGRTASARDRFNMVLRYVPDHAEAKRALADLDRPSSAPAVTEEPLAAKTASVATTPVAAREAAPTPAAAPAQRPVPSLTPPRTGTPPTPPPSGVATNAELLAIAKKALLAGNAEDAIKYCRDATNKDRNFADCYRVLGLAYDRINNRAAAKLMYKKFLALKPDAPDAREIRARHGL